MNPTLILPNLSFDPAWLAHEQEAGLLAQPLVDLTPLERQEGYSKRCKDLNAHLLSSRDEHLNHDLIIEDFTVTRPYNSQEAKREYGEHSDNSPRPGDIKIRSYNYKMTRSEGNASGEVEMWDDGVQKYRVTPRGTKQPSNNIGKDKREGGEDTRSTVLYFHGGGLVVGDLDSEDLTCRRICRAIPCNVYSVDYRLMPDFTADDALEDALCAFQYISQLKGKGKLVVMGSSSGGQLAAQVSQIARKETGEAGCGIDGVLLRGPVTVDATDGGVKVPGKWKESHKSMATEYYSSLLSGPALNAANRTKAKLPLEVESLGGMPKHWIQVCTNDIYYSDGACYAEALRLQNVQVELDVVEGWPHTFWLKAPLLNRAVQAENDMIDGLRWLLKAKQLRS